MASTSSNSRTPRPDSRTSRSDHDGMSHSQSYSHSHSHSQSQSRSQSQSQYQYYRENSLRGGQYSPRSPSFSSALGSPNARHPNPNNTTFATEREVGIANSSRDRYDGTPRPASPPIPRTLDDIRDQVAQEVAIHALNKMKDFDGVKLGVRIVMTSGRDEDYLRLIGAHLQFLLKSHKKYVFAIATSPFTGGSSFNTLLICSSSADLVQRCILLSSSKFLGRVIDASVADPTSWMATIRDLGVDDHDETALWDVLEKSAMPPIDPLVPPPGTRGIDYIVAEARAKLQRISAEQALEELRESQVMAPTFLVDIRSTEQRKREGAVHGSLILDRNVLEWKFDPRSKNRLPIADRYDLRIILFDQEGNMSSLAAYSLQQIGMLNATDIIGGYEAWKNAGLPIDLDTLTTTINTQNTTQNPQQTFATTEPLDRNTFLVQSDYVDDYDHEEE